MTMDRDAFPLHRAVWDGNVELLERLVTQHKVTKHIYDLLPIYQKGVSV